MNKIGLVVAMISEMEQMYYSLGTVIAVDNIGGFEVTEFAYQDKQIYMAVSGIGEVSAALATQALVLFKGVQLIINFGLVGALKPQFKQKQVVYVREEVHYDWSFNTQDDSRNGIYWHNPDNAIVPVNMGAYKGVVDCLGLVGVRIASADKFVNSTALKDKLVSQFDCDVCDMESAGINLTCIINKIPIIMLKAVSDNAEEGAVGDIIAVCKSGVDYYIDAVHKIISSL